MCCTTSRRPTEVWLEPLLDAVAEAAPLLCWPATMPAFMSKIALRTRRPAQARRRTWIGRSWRGRSDGASRPAAAWPTYRERVRAPHGLQLRHRRPAQCRQVDAVQRAHRTAAAAAANYPFCTIEPNIGRVPVPDPRLERCRARPVGQDRADPARVRRHRGPGRAAPAAARASATSSSPTSARSTPSLHVLRCFEGDDVAHVEGTVDPLRDAEMVETELMLADLDSLERRVDGPDQARARRRRARPRRPAGADRAGSAGHARRAAGARRWRSTPRTERGFATSSC